MAIDGKINVTIYRADRKLWAGASVTLTLIDPFADTRKVLVPRHNTKQGTSTVLLEKVPADKGQRYTLLATTPGHRGVAIFPIQPRPGGLSHTAVMMIPKEPQADFSNFSFRKLKEISPAFHRALAEEGKVTEEDFLSLEDPQRIAAALNLEAKLRNIKLGNGYAVDSIRKIDGLESVRVDRLRAWVDEAMPSQVERLTSFTKVPDWVNRPGHKEHPVGYKEQVPFGSLQISFAESPVGQLLSADIDMDLWYGVAHFGEWLKNHFTEQTTDQFTVYTQLFDQRVFPLYILKA